MSTPSLTTTSAAAESERAPSDTNIGWDLISSLSVASRIFAPGVELTPTEEDSPFKTAWTRQLGEQSLLNNIPKEFLNTAGRVVGWLFLDLVFYGGNGIVKGIQAL